MFAMQFLNNARQKIGANRWKYAQTQTPLKQTTALDNSAQIMDVMDDLAGATQDFFAHWRNTHPTVGTMK